MKDWPQREFRIRADLMDLMPNNVKPVVDPVVALESGLFDMSEAVALLRTYPKRHQGNIGMVVNKESPGRIQHQLLRAVRGWAFINRRDVKADDYSLAIRLACDSIPIQRRAIIKAMMTGADQNGIINLAEIMERAGYIQLQPLEWDMMDLYALGVVKPRQADLTGAHAQFKLDDKMVTLLEKGRGLICQ